MTTLPDLLDAKVIVTTLVLVVTIVDGQNILSELSYKNTPTFFVPKLWVTVTDVTLLNVVEYVELPKLLTVLEFNVNVLKFVCDVVDELPALSA
jgi:hypothetical protein